MGLGSYSGSHGCSISELLVLLWSDLLVVVQVIIQDRRRMNGLIANWCRDNKLNVSCPLEKLDVVEVVNSLSNLASAFFNPAMTLMSFLRAFGKIIQKEQEYRIIKSGVEESFCWYLYEFCLKMLTVL